jgi:anti-sigma regulatory factor (Ser/Thr protein kinase)
MIDARSDDDGAAAPPGLTTVPRIEALQGLDAMATRLLKAPHAGLIVAEAAAQDPDMAARADAVAQAGGLALLVDATFAWKTDVASVLVLAAGRHWPVLEKCRDRMRLAVHEAVVNAVLHGCLRIAPNLRDTLEGWTDLTDRIQTALADPERGDLPVLVTMVPEADAWIVRVEDIGPGFAPPSPETGIVPPRPGVLSMRGRGLMLMRAVCDTVSWERGGRTCVLTLRRVDPDDACPRPGAGGETA